MNIMELASETTNDYKDLIYKTGNSGSKPSLVIVKTKDHSFEGSNYNRGRTNPFDSTKEVSLSPAGNYVKKTNCSLIDASRILTHIYQRTNTTHLTKDADIEMEAKTMPLLTSYIEAAMAEAKYEPFEGDTYYAFIPSCQGVWSNEKTIDDCKRDLRDALELWLILKLRDNDHIPVINGFDLNSLEELEVIK